MPIPEVEMKRLFGKPPTASSPKPDAAIGPPESQDAPQKEQTASPVPPTSPPVPELPRGPLPERSQPAMAPFQRSPEQRPDTSESVLVAPQTPDEVLEARPPQKLLLKRHDLPPVQRLPVTPLKLDPKYLGLETVRPPSLSEEQAVIPFLPRDDFTKLEVPLSNPKDEISSHSGARPLSQPQPQQEVPSERAAAPEPPALSRPSSESPHAEKARDLSEHAPETDPQPSRDTRFSEQDESTGTKPMPPEPPKPPRVIFGRPVLKPSPDSRIPPRIVVEAPIHPGTTRQGGPDAPTMPKLAAVPTRPTLPTSSEREPAVGQEVEPQQDATSQESLPKAPASPESSPSKETVKPTPMPLSPPSPPSPVAGEPNPVEGQPAVSPPSEPSTPEPRTPPAPMPPPPTVVASIPRDAPAPEEPPGAVSVPEPPQEQPTLAVPSLPPPPRPPVATPLDADAPRTREIKEYLRETAPILEELSLLMMKAPSLAIEDYDPSDEQAILFPPNIFVKMEDMKRRLQILDSKSFAIIPPKRYEEFHSIVRESVTQTFQACDAIIAYMQEPTSAHLEKAETHLRKARELIRLTRAARDHAAVR